MNEIVAGVPASSLRKDHRGITAVEYGIVAAFLCLSLLGIFTSFGAALTGLFNRAASGL